MTGSLKYSGSTVGTYDIVENVSFSHPNYTITFVKGKMTIKAETVQLKTSKPNMKAVPKSKKVKKGEKVILKAPKGIALYYTTNGKNPTEKS